MKPHRGTLVLVLGVLSLIICQPLGIVAWILGSADLKAMAAGTMDPEGKSLTTIGKILGIISVVILVVAVVLSVVFALIAIPSAMKASHG